jgi:hypothetical protein
MNYNKLFRVFDNGGETADRYTVFLRNEPEIGALGLNDTPTHPTYGFSQWGDFNVIALEINNKEILFDSLPENVQQHIIDRFEITESNIFKDVVYAVMENDMEAASLGIKNLIISKVENLIRKPKKLFEFNKGAIRIVGDDVLVNGKRIGEIKNDLENYDKGIELMLDDGTTHDFDSIQELFNFIIDTFRIKEFNEGPVKITGDSVYIKNKKVGTIESDPSDVKSGIKLLLHGGEGYEFNDIKSLYNFLIGKFNLKEDNKKINEATTEQKSVVKSLRQLAKKLNISEPRFRSLGGKAEFVEMSPKNWRENSIPNELRKKAVIKIFNAVPQDFSDVNYGNVRKEALTLTVPQWIQLLNYYDINVDIPVSEGYTILPKIDEDRYPNREDQGLEGPFRAKNGKIVYYDSKEGKYYDSDTDLYIEYKEWQEMDK